ncbi:Undecaprenol kinase [Weissella viridescens]|uniref:Undecaprenol kinase n=1 Tax=Weissella viridescens TaxID=1629 RepID=A0A380P909_WEIVI|nr:Undecaprenol kinase [Weissella viridescens]
MRFHLVAAILVLCLGIYLGIGRSDWIWITIAVSMVIMSEFVNTMVEAIVDLIVGERYEPLAKVAKDVAAGGF